MKFDCQVASQLPDFQIFKSKVGPHDVGGTMILRARQWLLCCLCLTLSVARLCGWRLFLCSYLFALCADGQSDRLNHSRYFLIGQFRGQWQAHRLPANAHGMRIIFRSPSKLFLVGRMLRNTEVVHPNPDAASRHFFKEIVAADTVAVFVNE